MDDPVICCEHWASGAGSEWPFRRTVIFGWYDGPTSGIVECANCLAEYRFGLIDWDCHTEDAEDPRIFVLEPLPSGSLDALLNVDPKNPFFEGKHGTLSYRWRVAAETLPSEVFQQVQKRFGEILAQEGSPELLVAWIRPGDPLLAARKLGAEDSLFLNEWLSSEPKAAPLPPLREDYTDHNWFAFLGLERLPREEEEPE
jgi:hypothetical protein